jgi:carboxymethylenebutenolidase
VHDVRSWYRLVRKGNYMQEEFGTPRTKEERIESLIHLYVDGGLNRRDLVRRLARLAGGVAAAATLLETAGLAQVRPTDDVDDIRVGEDDRDIEWKDVTYPGQVGQLRALLAYPRPFSRGRGRGATARNEPQPGVLVIHENRGLVEHTRDVTRRMAKAGFVALGIDFLSRQGGTAAFADDAARAQAYGRTLQTERHEDLVSSIEYLRQQDNVVADRIGAVGFCAGGGNIFYSVYNGASLQAAVPFYGTPPNPLPPAERVTTPLLAIFSENDRNQAARIPGLSESLVTARVTFGIHVYKGTSHAFFNDTGAVYNRAAAIDAWAKTIDFLDTHLRGS